MITIFAVAVEGALIWTALGQWVAVSTGIQAGLFTHACALVIHQTDDTRADVGTGCVEARHVSATRCGHLTFVQVLTNKAIALVSILARAEVGSIGVVAQSVGAAVMWQA